MNCEAPLYYVPDIDIMVRMWINSTDTGQPMACVETNLGNEKTVFQSGVSWATALIIFLTFAFAAVISARGHLNVATYLTSNVMSLLGYFQALAFVGMSSVTLPPIVRSWTQNFQWTMGIISLEPLQTLGIWYQRATGGTPTTILSNLGEVSVHVYKRSNQRQDANQDVQSTTVRGIERVGFTAHIEPSNIFFTFYTLFIILLILSALCVLLIRFTCELLVRKGKTQSETLAIFGHSWRLLLKGILFKIVSQTQKSQQIL